MTCSVTWRVAGVGVFGTRSGWPGLIVAAIRAVLQGAGVVFRRAFVRVASISKADLGGSLTRLEARFCDLECSIDRPDGGVDSLAHRLAQVLVGCAAGQLMIPNCAAATVTPAAPRKRRRCQAMSSAVLAASRECRPTAMRPTPARGSRTKRFEAGPGRQDRAWPLRNLPHIQTTKREWR